MSNITQINIVIIEIWDILSGKTNKNVTIDEARESPKIKRWSFIFSFSLSIIHKNRGQMAPNKDKKNVNNIVSIKFDATNEK